MRQGRARRGAGFRGASFVAPPLLGLLVGACGGDSPSSPSTSAEPATTIVVAGDAQVGVEDFVLSESVAVGAVDEAGNAVTRAGLAVQWMVLEGGGSIESSDAATNASGRAFARWRTGTLGDQVLQASIEDTEPARLEARVVDAPVVFQSSRNGGGLFRMTDDGIDVIRITGNSSDHGAVWGPNREWIAFQREDQVWIARASGSDARAITDFTPPTAAGGFAGGPSFSPDGQSIVFDIKQAGSCEQADRNLYVIATDGTGQTQLTEGCGEGNSSPRWSPDGARIAFQSKRDRGGAAQNLTDVFVMNADGSEPVNLTAFMPDGAIPVWSPDGSQILFSRRFEAGDPLPTSVWVMDPDGSNAEMVYETDAAWVGGTGWSPDGESVLLTVSTGGSDADIYVLELATGVLTRLTDRPNGFDGFAAW